MTRSAHRQDRSGQLPDAERDLFDHFIRRSDETSAFDFQRSFNRAKPILAGLTPLLPFPLIGSANVAERPASTPLPEQDRGALRATVAFLSRRLEERQTIDWAIRTHPDDLVKRRALLELINGRRRRQLSRAWQTAWHLIEESWDNPPLRTKARAFPIKVSF